MSRFRGGPAVAYAVLLFSLAATAALMYYVWRAATLRDRLAFERQVDRIEATVETRLRTYSELLRATTAFFVVEQNKVDRETFRLFIEGLGIERRYPGILGIGFSDRIDGDLDAYEAEARREFPGFTVRPRDERNEYHTIRYLEPQNRRNQVAMGFDMFSEPVRRAAMEAARDSGEPVASGKVTLVQEIDPQKQAGFLIYTPLYFPGTPADATVEQRRASLEGFIYSPFRADDLLTAALTRQLDPGIAVAVYDGMQIDAGKLMHLSPAARRYTREEARLRGQRHIDVRGRPWAIAVWATPAFGTFGAMRQLPLIGIAGTLISLILFLVTRAAIRSRMATEAAFVELEKSDLELRRSNLRYRSLVNATAAIVWNASPQGEIETEVPLWEVFTGQKPDEYLGRGWTEAIHPQDRDAFIRSWQQGSSERQPVEQEFRLRHVAGEWRYVVARGVPIFDAQGKLTDWVGTITDVHEQREAERAAAHHSLLMRTVTENAATALFMVDERGHATYMNPAARAMTGYRSLAEIGDRPLHYAIHHTRPDGSFYPLDTCPIDAASLSLTQIRAQEETLVRKDGEFFPVLFSVAPIERDGHRAGAVLELQDITERKRAEAAVREAAERFRFLAESVPQKIFTASPAGEIDYVNRQWMEFTGLSFQQVRDWGWTQIVHPADIEENIRSWKDSVASGEPFQFEHRFRRADGVYRWHLTRALPMHDASGAIVTWIGSNTDIDDQKRTQKRLERLYREAEAASRAKDDFLATVSHELRTPMTSILGWAKLLLTRGIDESRHDEALEAIHRAATVQAQLIEDVLDVSRIITGKVYLQLETIDLRSAIDAALRAVMPAAEVNGITIDVQHAEGSEPIVRGDPTRLQQIIWNLLSNAVKFTMPGGRVTVRSGVEEGRVMLEVSDTGQGIRNDFLPHVFDRFSQQDATSTRSHGGLGLGLSIVKHLAELHGGTVRAASEGEGRGATFAVSFPLAHGKKSASHQGRAALTGALGSEPKSVVRLDGVRVLVVDDEPEARRVISAMLERSGAMVETSASASEARAHLESQSFDVLVSDIAMPRENGHTFVRKLRRSGRTIPAIALTAYGRTSDREAALDAGFQHHLTKPIDPDLLASCIAEAAKRHE
jgi:PAS domain S-box-containing protein